MRSAATPAVSAADVLRAIRARPRPDPSLERCDMCAAPVDEAHQHVVDLQTRSLMCACRPCYLLFTAGAQQRYRAIPDRYLSFDAAGDAAAWEQLDIPVGLVFFFFNSVLESMVAFYPGPAGVTESELPLAAWESIAAANPQFATLTPDVEALLVRAGRRGDPRAHWYLAPIDACYELAGRLRTLWRGFDGGQQARTAIDEFFHELDRRSASTAAVSPHG